jgi:hypothetical protein
LISLRFSDGAAYTGNQLICCIDGSAEPSSPPRPSGPPSQSDWARNWRRRRWTKVAGRQKLFVPHMRTRKLSFRSPHSSRGRWGHWREVPFDEAAKLGGHGGDRRSEKARAVQAGRSSLKWNTKAHWLARLDRDGHAELAAKVRAREISANAAATEAHPFRTYNLHRNSLMISSLGVLCGSVRLIPTWGHFGVRIQ